MGYSSPVLDQRRGSRSIFKAHTISSLSQDRNHSVVYCTLRESLGPNISNCDTRHVFVDLGEAGRARCGITGRNVLLEKFTLLTLRFRLN